MVEIAIRKFGRTLYGLILTAALTCTACDRLVAQDANEGRTGMLVLGSHNMETLKARVDIAYELYRSGREFDYIIVSGGCGAHGSTLCEASEMAALLREKGVPADKIFKEENSKSTVQNYCYSRALKTGDGKSVIRVNDTLFVVSNHWHAIPVAARFTKYDGVKAFYHIEGDIVPDSTDRVDYTNIFDNGLSSEQFCR
jgi:uncharacterized SAM-binding protein YcdF (DUF218 family)